MKQLHFLLTIITIVAIQSCGLSSDEMKDTTVYKHTNELINSSSPYLQQHAHNPVDWMPWGDEAFEKAKREDKLLFISIGYSACHWCHVMEHETFEDEAAAEYINNNFVSIKVDREERPDVDAVYMSAVQIMTGRGGWPLNCIALSDGRPVFGGTYFRKNDFIDRLKSIIALKNSNYDKMLEYATKLSRGVANTELISAPKGGKGSEFHGGPWSRTQCNISGASIDREVDEWRKRWDREMGLSMGAPKFPLPTNLDFLLHYGVVRGDNDALAQVQLTLNAMCRGGIYDQAGGGFARYSVDSDWKVPHFEKMLYDNAQLLTTYSHAWQVFEDDRYKEVVYGIVNYLSTELEDDAGGFRSALDADSDGEEGKYYVWTKAELEEVLTVEEFNMAELVYDIEGGSYWEHGNNVLMRWLSDEVLAEKLGVSVSEMLEKMGVINAKLANHREATRVKPGLDDKVLTSWTALTVSGLIDAYRAFKDEEHLKRAKKALLFILNEERKEDGSLYHVYHEKEGAHTNGFLEDYAFTIAACLDMYEVTFDPRWLGEAKELMMVSFDLFYDTEVGVFWYTSSDDKGLFARTQENDDSVIPSSNSTMARNLFKLGRYEGRLDWIERCDRMLLAAWEDSHNIRRATGWAQVLLMRSEPYFEVAITATSDEDMHDARVELYRTFRPQTMLAGGEDVEGQPGWLKGKFPSEASSGDLRFFVCREGACHLPVSTLIEVEHQLKAEK
jgi:uncharacterized protein YyaL (SSP411 family)